VLAGRPDTDSRPVYDKSQIIKWNQEGIELVAQAKTLIDAQLAAGEPKA
jgi:hypothetical protein